jgi:hypothetical protein
MQFQQWSRREWSILYIQILSSECNSSDLTAVSQKSQDKSTRMFSWDSEAKDKDYKAASSEETEPFYIKTLHSDKWWTSQVVILEV